MIEVKPATVLVVDDMAENLRVLSMLLRRAGLIPRPVTSGRLAIEAAVVDPPDLVLLDVNMPQMSGLEVCRWFKKDDRLSAIPIIFISGNASAEDKVSAFRAGGVDYVAKPFQEQEVLARVQTHLRLRQLQLELQAHTDQLERRIDLQVQAVTASQAALIFALAKLAEARDEDTGQHVERVQSYARALAEHLGELGLHGANITPAYVDNIFQTASMHDIGKVAIPDAVLLKPGQLTREEFDQMKLHTVFGAATLGAVLQRYPDNQFLRMGVDVARSHHEKWDGSGYPDGLKGAAIPLSARIVALADFYDAVTSKRCYRPAFSLDEARAMVEKGAETHFDPAVVQAWRSLEGDFRRIWAELRDR